MKLNTTKLKELNYKEIEKTNGGQMTDFGKWIVDKYLNSKGPEMEGSYKYGMPGGKW
ncbi:hypothetical protein [Bacillus paranthracis]|uniref:hypothetical protein n=1 Tax=Bacillus paranthracis TaxID=2026186 RepID=UPI0032FD5BDC|nr:hypothetical protein [Bacillus cereus]HDR8090378.1 hypothetical protein [Bacillus cereus]